MVAVTMPNTPKLRRVVNKKRRVAVIFFNMTRVLYQDMLVRGHASLACAGRPAQASAMKWTDIDQQVCSVARALSVVGERWTLLIVRDAFKGTRRFDDFQRNLGVTRHRLSERLASLVEHGVLTKTPYSDRPVRYEYRLTRKGLALYPVLMSLSHWGDTWMDDGSGPPLRYWHSRCGKETQPVLSCRECGDPLRPEEVSAKLGTVLTHYVKTLKQSGSPIPADGALPVEAAGFQAVEQATWDHSDTGRKK